MDETKTKTWFTKNDPGEVEISRKKLPENQLER